MRDAFAKTITELGPKDPQLVLLSGDIGNRMFDKFKEAQPARFYNCGVAEANMISVAAGLAMTGFRPWVYTIASFLTYRPFEQIRVDVAYHHLPVVLVGTGAGLCYASNGPTHHTLEDIALYRALPGMVIACPGDAFEVTACMRELQKHTSGPAYLRLGKKGEPKVHAAVPELPIGVAHEMRKGRDAVFLTTGNMLHDTLVACDRLRERGIDAGLWHFPWVQPIDTRALELAFASAPLVVSVEEHSVDGGFGSLVAEWRAGQSQGGRLLRCGVPRRFIHETTEQEHARTMCGLDPEGLAAQVVAALEGRTSTLPLSALATHHSHG